MYGTLNKNSTPKPKAVVGWIFSVEYNGEGPRSKFEQEDGQTDSENYGTCQRL